MYQCAIMMAGEKHIINSRNPNEKKDERRVLQGLKNLWLNENITTLFWPAMFAAEDAVKKVLYLPGSPASLS